MRQINECKVNVHLLAIVLFYFIKVDAMNLSKGYSTSSRHAQHSQKQRISIAKGLQQGGKFFQLDYLFTQPKINWFSRRQQRIKHHHNHKNQGRTIDFASIEATPSAKPSRAKTIDMKETQKTVEEITIENENMLYIGDRGEAIHSKKCDCRIRTISSFNQNRISEVTLRNQLRTRVQQRIVDSDKPTPAKNYPLMVVNAQGISYSERNEQRPKSKGSFCVERRNHLILERRRPSKEQETRNSDGKQGRPYRPWSPLHHEAHFSIDQLAFS